MENPAFYKSVNRLQRRDASVFSDEFSDKFERMSGRCIDIGSGPGDVVMDFILPKLPPNATVVCSDISESMVSFGREEYKNDNRVSYIHLDIESPLPKRLIGQFDNVTSFYCLHWCHNIRRAFENIFELVRPGGNTLATFIANFPGYDSYRYLAEYSRYQPYMEDVDRHIPVFQDVTNKRDDMQTLLKEVGFEVRHCSVRENNYTFKSREMFGKLMLSLNPFIKRMPTGLREEYKKDLTEEGLRCVIPRRGKSNDQAEYGVSYTFFVHGVLEKTSDQVTLQQIIYHRYLFTGICLLLTCLLYTNRLRNVIIQRQKQSLYTYPPHIASRSISRSNT